MVAPSPQDWRWWVQSAISVKLGYVTDASAFRHMLAYVHYKMPSALSAREEYGSMVAVSSNAVFVPAFFVKMTSLSIRLAVKWLRQRTSNVYHAIVLDNIPASDVSHAIVKTMSGAKVSNIQRGSFYHVPSVALILQK